MIKINRKTIVIASMVVLLVVAGYLNWRYADMNSQQVSGGGNQQQGGGNNDLDAADVFSRFRTEREETRAQEITSIDSIINNSNTDQTTLAEAQKMKLELVDSMEKELLLEGLIKAKGFEDVYVMLSDQSVNVIVKESEMTQAKVAQILDIVMRETDVETDNVKITQST
ncbi:MAG: SpoIIIAH-like family protein [Clostridiales bacterium]|nr:SpoIIIAH-like family protein [Clostridiales bacterium]